ncbi:MAG: hypothetical protein LC803_21115 [Acidobacteria bacterium]|nr:hypothetical protein [Acidobacteriota bacterium]
MYLLHHRLTNRHISFTKVVSAVVLCIQSLSSVPEWLLMGAHPILFVVQVVSRLWIKMLSPNRLR